MSDVRPHILRQFLDAIYGRRTTAKAVEGATVDEYLALVRSGGARRAAECPDAQLRRLQNSMSHSAPVRSLCHEALFNGATPLICVAPRSISHKAALSRLHQVSFRLGGASETSA
jgi:hypothetical protein